MRTKMNAVAVLLASSHLLVVLAGSSSTIGDCIHKAHHAFTEHQLRQICKFTAEWMQGVAAGKSHGFDPSAAGITNAQVDFMKSLSTSDKPWPLQNWPNRPPNAKPRKEYRMLTDEERHRFHKAVNILKLFYIDDTDNIYDTFVDFHLPEVSPSAHFGPNFLGWHREYLHRFERALQLVDPDATIPYWDSTMDIILKERAVDTMMWTEEFLGNKGNVTTGPFKNWALKEPVSGRTHLWRSESTFGGLFNDFDYNYVVSINNFRNLTNYVDSFFEGMHGQNHGWVGGAMGNVPISPADPVFFLHHAFMDKVWYDQQMRVFREIGRQHYFYPREDDLEAYAVGKPWGVEDPRDSPHFYDNPMWPFTDKMNYQGLSDIYFLHYYYEEQPTCSTTKPSCGSPYLFCMEDISKCVPKLKAGANCEDFEGYNPCYNGQCVNGKCTAI